MSDPRETVTDIDLTNPTESVTKMAEIIFTLLCKLETPSQAMAVVTILAQNIYDNTNNQYKGIEHFANNLRDTIINTYGEPGESAHSTTTH